MTTRTVTTTIRRPDGSPWAGAEVAARLTPGSYTGATTYPGSRVRAVAGADGLVSLELWVNAEGAAASVYEVLLPGGEVVAFVLPTGPSPADLSALRTASPPVPVVSLQSLVDPLDERVTALEQGGGSGGAPLSNAVPSALGVAVPGVALQASRADHVHPLPTPAAIGAATTQAVAGETAARAAADAGLQAQLDGKAAATDPRLSDARTPTGGAGGVLSGNYPNPGFAVDMATQGELDAEATARAAADAALDTRVDALELAPPAHTHPITAITGLQAALDAKLSAITLQALADAASIAWNVANGVAASVTLGGNRTLANPTGLQAGASYVLIVKQDATGNRTLSYGSAYKWPGGTAPTLSTAPAAVDILTFISDGSVLYGVAAKGFS